MLTILITLDCCLPLDPVTAVRLARALPVTSASVSTAVDFKPIIDTDLEDLS